MGVWELWVSSGLWKAAHGGTQAGGLRYKAARPA